MRLLNLISGLCPSNQRQAACKKMVDATTKQEDASCCPQHKKLGKKKSLATTHAHKD